MTYICRACSVQHDIPRREDCPEVGICPVCQDVHALYLVKRELAPDASPWVLVKDALPKVGEVVLVAWLPIGMRGVGWADTQGLWSVTGCVGAPPDYWCPIPPLPGEPE